MLRVSPYGPEHLPLALASFVGSSCGAAKSQLAKNCLTQEIPAQSSAKTLPEMLISIIITFDIIIIIT